MIQVLRAASTVAVLIVVASFTMFVVDEAGKGSDQQVRMVQNDINTTAPDATTEKRREAQHSAVREKIDDANDVLVKPFTGIVSGSGSVWVQRGVTTVLALLLYGLLSRVLISYVAEAPSRARSAIRRT
ncbi:MAG TPA: hypothetical protein VF752_16965 [Thermoleophilaceae bacterium]